MLTNDKEFPEQELITFLCNKGGSQEKLQSRYNDYIWSFAIK